MMALIVLTVSTFIAAITDIWKRRIPNIIVLGMILFGFANALQNGWITLILRVIAAIILFFIAYKLLYIKGILPGGDLKILVGTFILLGPTRYIDYFGYMALPVLGVLLYYFLAKGKTTFPLALPMALASIMMLMVEVI